MKRLLLAGLGATLYALLVALPLVHVTTWTGAPPTPSLLALAGLPAAAWAVALVRPAPWATLWLFPVAHLPVLVARPELTGPLVYAGPEGLLALGAVVAVGAAWAVVALSSPAPPGARRPPRSRLRQGILPATTALAMALLLAAFVAPVLSPDRPPDAAPAQIAVLVGIAVAAHVGGRRVVGDLADLWFDGGERERWLAVALAERRSSPRTLWGSLVVAGVLAAIVVFAYGT